VSCFVSGFLRGLFEVRAVKKLPCRKERDNKDLAVPDLPVGMGMEALQNSKWTGANLLLSKYEHR